MGFSDSIDDIYEKFAFAHLLEQPEEIQSFGEKIDNEILACIQCGFCRAGCPTYAQTGLESMNARGRVLLAFNLMSGRLKPSEEMATRLYQCTNCLNCKYTCPSRVEVSDIVQAARQRLADSGFLPQVFQASSKSITQYGNPFGEPREKRTDTFPAGFQTGPEGGGGAALRRVRRILPGHQYDPEPDDHPGQGRHLLHGPGSGRGLLRLSELPDRARRMISGPAWPPTPKNLPTWGSRRSSPVVRAVTGPWPSSIPAYGGSPEIKVHHVTTFLNDLLSQGKIPLKGNGGQKIAYHDPCDLGRHMNIFEEPRNVLKSLPGVELTEFKLNRLLAKCCGSGGGVKGFDNPLSQDIAYQRVLQALEVGAEVIVSACPSCKSNLTQGAARVRKEKKGKIKVKDITEVVASALA